MLLLQSSRSHIENEKKLLKNQVTKAIFFQRHKKLFEMRQKIPCYCGIRITLPRQPSGPSRASSTHMNSP